MLRAKSFLIKGVVNATNGIVSSATFGLQATKTFLDKAWESTNADKVLNAITTAVVIHNGVQLSTNLTATIGETASVVLDAIGINDSNNQPFDINGIVKAKLTSLVTTMIGAENFALLTTKLATYNRIYQASANVFDATRDLFDSARSTAELTAENTGKIGNALLESGVVSADSYEGMLEEVNPQSRALSRIEGFRNNLDSIEETVSTVSNIASEVVSTKDSYKELLDARDEWKATNEAVLEERKTEVEEIKLESQANTDIEEIDFDRDES